LGGSFLSRNDEKFGRESKFVCFQAYGLERRKGKKREYGEFMRIRYMAFSLI